LRNLRAILILLLALLFALPAAAPAAFAGGDERPLRPHTQRAPRPLTVTHATSYVAAGYLTQSASNPGGVNTVTYVQAKFAVPATAGLPVDCSDNQVRLASAWVGLDDGPTIEQIGIDFGCFNGSPVYQAWYQMYPLKKQPQALFSIHPGDVMDLLVQKDPNIAGAVDVCGWNLTTGQGGCQNGIAAASGATFSTAEWAVEASQTSPYLMPGWGSVTFYEGNAQVYDAGITYVTPIDSPHQQTLQIDLTTQPPVVTNRATTSGLSVNNTQFYVQQITY
jgi:hypothetical protein